MGNKLNEALEVHEELNPLLWDGMELKEDVKNKLLEIANTFIEGLDYPLNVADIRFLGSNASYNYNDNSDIDLHIISNFDLAYVDKDILQILYNASKNSFNNHHDITIHNIPVELYIEDMHSMNATNGAYSLLKDEWVMIPQPIEYTIPDYSKELQEYLGEVDYVMSGGTKEEIEDLINRIYLGRKDGLATEGEASIGNCVFKELRNMGIMDKLRERFYDLESEQLTLENKKLEEDDKVVTTDANADMDSLVDDMVTEMQPEPTEEQIKEKEAEYEEYIETHVANVKKAYEKIVKDLVNNDLTGAQMEQLEANIDAHDKDKYIPFMFDAYRRNHMPVNEKEKQDAEEDYAIAWDYHKHNNTHHWEYWLNSAGEFAQDINEAEMKLAYAEMLCDWLSFGFRKEATSATGESTEFETWYNESKDNIKIHPQLKEWFDEKVETIINFIDVNKDTLYENLQNNNDCGKIEEDVIIEGNKVKWHGKEFKVEEQMVKSARLDESKKNLLIELNNGDSVMMPLRSVLKEMEYKDYKNEVGFKIEYNVKVPLKVEQEDDFDTYGDNDYEMDVDIDSLYEAYEDAQKQIESMTSDEDLLKEIFPNVGRGRVYVGNIYLDETVLDFDIGFSDIQDPTEKGNEIKLDEKELKEQIQDLAETLIDNVDYLSAKQGYINTVGYDEYDEDTIDEWVESDDYVSYSIHLDTNKSIEINSILNESKKLEESSLSRIYQHYSTNPFGVLSACRTELDGFQNKKNSIDLQNQIRSAKLGYIPVDGMWKEDGQTSAEDSYFVPYTGNDFEKFKDWMIDMGKRYNQYSVLISDGQGQIAYYDQNGNVTSDNGVADEFKDIKFSNDTIDKNIDQAGAGGYTRLKGSDKRFQLQKEDYDPIFYKSTTRNSSTVNKKFAQLANLEDTENEKQILTNLINVDYGFFRIDDIKHKIKVLYDIDVHFDEDEGEIEFEDVKLAYKKQSSDYVQITSIE